MKDAKRWNKRPKGCTKTISGMHIPEFTEWYLEGDKIKFFCNACEKIDDTGKFMKWLGFKFKKIDDRKPL